MLICCMVAGTRSEGQLRMINKGSDPYGVLLALRMIQIVRVLQLIETSRSDCKCFEPEWASSSSCAEANGATKDSALPSLGDLQKEMCNKI